MTSLAALNVISKITFGGKIVLRDSEEKASYKGPLFSARPNDLIISKIRVLQGSFAIVGEALSYLAVSPEYPVYEVSREMADPAYLNLALRLTDALGKLTATGNTTKQRVRPSAFEDLRIPLPSLAVQQAAVKTVADADAAAEATTTQADALEREARSAFEAALGLAAPPPLPDRPLFISRFKDLDRWSHDAALRRAVSQPGSTVWPNVRLGNVIADLENGWSPQCLERSAEDGEWGVLKVGAVSFGTFDEGQNKALPAALDARPALEVRKGELIISRANVTRLVGTAAYVKATRPRLMLSDKLFRVVQQPKSPIDLVFLSAVLGLRPLREQIEAALTGTSPTMKNISKPALLALTFPLPPLVEQESLVKALGEARTRAAALRLEAAEGRKTARAAFEAASLGA